MMKILTVWMSCLLIVAAPESDARLGDTRDQLEARYGLPKSEQPSIPPLLEGARELTFFPSQWTIRCALLLAKDGRYYVVRQTYRKRSPPSTARAANKEITEHERNWLLKTEAGSRTWRKQSSAGHGDTLKESLIKQFLLPRDWNLGTLWLREDGSTARMEALNRAMIFDLPQARKYEEELKAMKDAEAAAQSQKGLQELERNAVSKGNGRTDHSKRPR